MTDGATEAQPSLAEGQGSSSSSPAAPTSPSPDASGQVHGTFKQYSQALLDGDGAAAWSLLDAHTARFYVQVLRDALSLPARDLSRLDYTHKITVLRLRTEFRKPHLQTLAGRDVFVIAVTNGWISRSTIQATPALSRVVVSGGYATGFVAAEPNVPAFSFIFEDGQWKLALWKAFEAANAMILQMHRESGLGEKEFLLTLIRRLSKYEVSEKVFEGPLE